MSIFTNLLAMMDKASIQAEPRISGHVRSMLSYIGALDSIGELIELMRGYDGYARQAAIERSVRLARPELLPYIVERLNDWVPQVRDTARSSILGLLPSMPVPEVIEVLPAIMKLRSAGRCDHSEWLVEFERVLLRRAPLDALLAGVNANNIKIARACFDVLQRTAAVDAPALVLFALNSRRDIAMALQAAKMIAHLPPEEWNVSYAAAMRSNFGAVRIFAVRALLREQPGDAARELAISLLLDPQSSIRAAAITYLLANAVDARAYYRDLLGAAATPPAIVRVALASLGNLRHAGDVTLVRQFCKHPMPSVRLCAYTAWFRTAQGDKDAVAQEAILDEARSVKKAALEMFVKHGAFIPFASICTSLRGAGNRDLLVRFAAQSGQSVPTET